MSTWRVVVGAGGLLVVGVVAWWATWSPRWGSIGPVLLFLGWGLFYLAGEVAGLIAALNRPARTAPPPDARRADGRVDRAAMRGVVAVPNAKDPAYRRLVEREEGPEWAGRAGAPPRGEVPALLGSVTLVCVFVGRHRGSWSDEEVARTLGSLKKAASWIEQEAALWGARANIALADTYVCADDPGEERDVPLEVVTEGDHLGLFEGQAIEHDMRSASRAVATLGFSGIADLVETLGRRVEGDHTVWLVFPRASGRSHAIDEKATLLPGASLAVCYAAYADFPGPLSGAPSASSTTLAHELMHLFGATDKYERPLADFPPGTVTHRDIMRLDQSSLARLSVDALTAMEVGWSADGARPVAGS